MKLIFDKGVIWEVNIFCLLINLLIIQTNESNNRGEANKIIFIISM